MTGAQLDGCGAHALCNEAQFGIFGPIMGLSAVFGPIDICFRVSNSTAPFILHWTPDEGAFCCQKDITLFPT